MPLVMGIYIKHIFQYCSVMMIPPPWAAETLVLGPDHAIWSCSIFSTHSRSCLSASSLSSAESHCSSLEWNSAVCDIRDASVTAVNHKEWGQLVAKLSVIARARCWQTRLWFPVLCLFQLCTEMLHLGDFKIINCNLSFWICKSSEHKAGEFFKFASGSICFRANPKNKKTKKKGILNMLAWNYADGDGQILARLPLNAVIQ